MTQTIDFYVMKPHDLFICGFLSENCIECVGDNSISFLRLRRVGTLRVNDHAECTHKLTTDVHHEKYGSILSLGWDHFLIIKGGQIETLAAFPQEAVNKDLTFSNAIEDVSVQVTMTWKYVFCVTSKGDCMGTLRGSESWRNVEVAEGTKIHSVQCGHTHTVGITGNKTAGLIIDDGSTLLFKPICPKIPIKAVSCGKEHVLLLTQIGVVLSFGIGSRGQLGHGTVENVSEPKVVEAIEGVCMVNIAAGGWHSAAVSDIGDVYTWGWNESGQLGFPCQQLQGQSQGQSKDTSEQVEIVNVQTIPCVLDIPGTSEEVKVTDISCGSRHTAVVTDRGDLYTWGWNAYGQLGLGDKLSRDKPTLVEDMNTKNQRVRAVHCGGWTTVVETEQIG